MTTVSTGLSTPTPLERFLDPPDDGLSYELLEGKLVGHEMSPISSWVASELLRHLGNAAAGPPLRGWAMAEATVRCFAFMRQPHGRRPDVAYVSIDRLPVLTLQPTNVVPNFVAEVISPSDEVVYLERKILEYLRAGIDTVWVVNWDTRQIRAHHGDPTNARIYRGDDLVTLAELPTFRVKADDLFPPLGMAETLAEDDDSQKDDSRTRR